MSIFVKFNSALADRFETTSGKTNCDDGCAELMNEFSRLLVVGICLSAACVAQAQESVGSALTLELNKVENEGEKCAITFLVANKTASNLKKLSYGIVLFDSDLRVERMTALDFGSIEAGRSRVRKFNFAKTDCAKLGQILINDTKACETANQGNVDCGSALELSNRTKLNFIK